MTKLFDKAVAAEAEWERRFEMSSGILSKLAQKARERIATGTASPCDTDGKFTKFQLQ